MEGRSVMGWSFWVYESICRFQVLQASFRVKMVSGMKNFQTTFRKREKLLMWGSK